MEETGNGKLVIVGDSAFAEIAYEYFTHDSPYEVAAFSVERAYLKQDQLFGLPVFPFESIEKELEPESHSAFVALTYGCILQQKRKASKWLLI
jgi:hypothetical protein